MSTFKNKTFIGGIAVTFLVPLCFYLVTRYASKGKVKIPGYYVVAEAGDSLRVDSLPNETALRLNDHRLVNQAGDSVSINADLKGKILVVNFFFTTCPTICPRLSNSVAVLQKAYRKNDSTFQFLSISVDPVRDTVNALKHYADRYGANWDRWWFLTGDKREIYQIARNELHLTAEPGDGGADDFIHSDKIVLIDRDRFIRGYYNGLDSFEVKRCADDMALLMISKDKRKKK